MDVYENTDYIRSTTASGETRSQTKGNRKQELRRVPSKNLVKVLVIVLGLALVISLGALCTLWMLYKNTLADFTSLKEENMMRTEEFNHLTAKYNTVRERLSLYEVISCSHSVAGWTSCEGKLYFFSSKRLNWWSSRQACVSAGADLVTITSPSEQASQILINESHWIGLNDLETEGHWVWVNNKTLSETGT
ncbi:hypothetical protein DNTS_035670, partial [Danionella cerebrum]